MGEKRWAHIICVNWNNDIGFIDNLKEKVSGELLPENFMEQCDLCLKRKGVCVKCEYKDCQTQFHVTCAVKAKLLKSWPKMCKEMTLHGTIDQGLPLFCH